MAVVLTMYPFARILIAYYWACVRSVGEGLGVASVIVPLFVGCLPNFLGWLFPLVGRRHGRT